MRLIKRLSLCLMLIPVLLSGQLKVEGTLVDSLTQEPIPFANVWLKGTSNGTLTNNLGRFTIEVDTSLSDSLEFSLIGYNPKKHNIHLIPKLRPFWIELSSKSFELNAVIITPITAQEYIRRAIISIENNYDIGGRKDRYYYREVIKENGTYNRFTEAILDLYQPRLNPSVHDTAIIRIKGGQVLDNAEYIKFMRKSIKKKVDKDNKKRVKKGELTKEFTDATEYISFSSPYIFIDSNFTTKAPSFLDSIHFDKYEYQIEYGYQSKGRDMLCVSFNQKKKVYDNLHCGYIYIVDSSYAIEGIDYGWSEKGKKQLIPAWAKAALWVYRLQIDDPDLVAKIRFNESNGKWSLDHYFINLSGRFTKKYFFDDNESSRFDINQSFVFIEPLSRLNPKDSLLKRNVPLHKQVKTSNKKLDWNKYRKLEPENLKK